MPSRSLWAIALGLVALAARPSAFASSPVPDVCYTHPELSPEDSSVDRAPYEVDE